MFEGSLLKVIPTFANPIRYTLPLGDNKIDLNNLLGKKLKFTFDGNIYCLDSGVKISKSYFNGYSYNSFMTLAECDQCMVRPELCHFANGTCRDSEWGKANCFIPHTIYLAVSSDLKVGITRERNVPNRFIDQGASYALPILTVKDRLRAGLIEVELAKSMKDKTNWKNMLLGKTVDCNLLEKKEEIFFQYGDLFDDLEAQEVESEVYHLNYPMLSIPSKIELVDFDKDRDFSGILTGIKGSYLLFQDKAFNSRKFQGYYFRLEILD